MLLKNKERSDRKNDSCQVSSLLKNTIWPQCHGSSMRMDTRVQRSNEPPFLYRRFNGGLEEQSYQDELVENTKTFSGKFYQRFHSRFISSEREFTQAMVRVVGNFTSGAADIYRDEDQKKPSFIKVIDCVLKKHSPAVWENDKERENFHIEFARSYFTELDVGKASKAVYYGEEVSQELGRFTGQTASYECFENANRGQESNRVKECMTSAKCGSI